MNEFTIKYRTAAGQTLARMVIAVDTMTAWSICVALERAGGRGTPTAIFVKGCIRSTQPEFPHVRRN